MIVIVESGCSVSDYIFENDLDVEVLFLGDEKVKNLGAFFPHTVPAVIEGNYTIIGEEPVLDFVKQHARKKGEPLVRS